MNNKSNKVKEWILNHKKTSTVIAIIISLPYLLSFLSLDENSTKLVNNQLEQTEVKMIYDVPSYFNKNIEDVEKILGTPIKNTEENQKKLSVKFETAEREYKKEDYNLLVEYNIKSRKCLSFLLYRNNDISIEEKDSFLKIANIDPNNKDYITKMIPLMDNPKLSTGLNIESKQTLIDEWDDLINLTKKAKIVYKDTKKISNMDAYEIYVDIMWYAMKVDMKRDVVAKFSKIKEKITGYKNIRFKDSNTGEVVAEVTSFTGSIEIYK